MKNPPLIVAGIIFALVAIIHFIRLFYHFQIIVNGTNIPYWANGIAFIVAGSLSIWMFYAASKKVD